MSRTNKQLDEIESTLNKIHEDTKGPTISEKYGITPEKLLPKAADSLTSVYAAGRPFRAKLPNGMNKVMDSIAIIMIFLMIPALFISIYYVILLGIAAGFILVSSPNKIFCLR